MIDLREHLQTALGSAYAIERELGGGGMSRVFVAREISLGREVVVKVLPPELAGELSAERFRREIQLAARLQHPHIVPVLAAGTLEGEPETTKGSRRENATLLFYTMPFIEGETLRARLQRAGELPIHDVVRMGRELADALAYAHERGVVHRDLKPENILVTRGHALVADFGVAKAVTASALENQGGNSILTSIGLALGTPTYMAPEQAAGDPATDHRADIYALGCVLYELLAGSPPFHGRPTQALLAAHIAEAPDQVSKRRPATPAPLAALIMRMLEKRPADRPQTADEVLALLESLGTISTPAADTIPTIQGAAALSPTLSNHPGTVLVETAPRRSRTAWRVGIAGGIVAGVALVAVAVSNLAGRRAEPVDAALSPGILVVSEGSTGSSPALTTMQETVRRFVADDLSSLEGVRMVSDTSQARFTISSSSTSIGPDSAIVRARLLDQRSQKVLRGFAPVRLSLSDPTGGLEGLRSHVRAAVAIVLHPMLGPGALPGGDSPSWDSWSEFATALVDVDRLLAGLEPPRGEMVSHLNRSFQLDTTFVQPLLWRALVAPGGLPLRRAADSVLTSILAERAQRLTAYERSLGQLISSRFRAERGISTRAAENLYRISPTQWTAGAYARELTQVRRYRAAIAIYDSLSGSMKGDNPNYWNGYRIALHLMGDHKRELRVARLARQSMPERVGVRGFEIRALIALDSGDAAMKAIDAALAAPAETDAGIAPNAVFSEAYLEFRAHGQDAYANRLLQKAVPFVTAMQAGVQARSGRMNLAESLLDLGQDSAARTLARQLIQEDSTGDQFNLISVVGIASANLGDTAAARREMNRAEVLGDRNRPYALQFSYESRAKIAAALGRDNEAIALTTQALVYGRGSVFQNRAMHGGEFARLRRNPEFVKLLKPRED